MPSPCLVPSRGLEPPSVSLRGTYNRHYTTTANVRKRLYHEFCSNRAQAFGLSQIANRSALYSTLYLLKLLPHLDNVILMIPQHTTIGTRSGLVMVVRCIRIKLFQACDLTFSDCDDLFDHSFL